ncbi:MAG: monovalent cation:proton antiporter-2 (CPA2) family protein [Acidiferrobacterales bacterium]
MTVLHETAIFLTAAIIAVPLFNRFGFGSVLGYLAAGIVIGPWGLGLITRVEGILHFSELGVVMLLFIIGLELQPSRLWVLRRSVFGLGLAQVVVTGAVLALIAYASDLPAQTAVIVGLGLSLSSTAFVLQMLAEKKQLTSAHGRASFAILLFQDLAVIPLLAIVPLLAVTGTAAPGAGVLVQTIKVVLVLVGLVVGGRFLLRYLFRLVASTGSNEIFTGVALLVVVGAALLMEFAGLSMALGAFLAGMLLADSEYRHELEANIEPFKRLLLGLFFIAVGMSANIGLIAGEPLRVLALAIGLLVIKSLVLLALGPLFKLSRDCTRNLAFILPQGGEFAFVLFNVAVIHQIMGRALADLLIVVVTVTMVFTPFLVLLNERIFERWLQGRRRRQFDTIEDTEHQIIIAGFGRFGQVIGRLLRVKRIPFTALEASSTQVDFVRRFGNKVYYGDASRLDLLRAARVDKAKVFVLAIDDIVASVRTAETVKRHFPNVEIYARARNRHHAHLLMDVGAKFIIRETFLSGLELARQVLHGLGETAEQARSVVAMFQRHDEITLAKQHAIHQDESKLIQSAREAARELEELFESDTDPQTLRADSADE